MVDLYVRIKVPTYTSGLKVMLKIRDYEIIKLETFLFHFFKFKSVWFIFMNWKFGLSYIMYIFSKVKFEAKQK